MFATAVKIAARPGKTGAAAKLVCAIILSVLVLTPARAGMLAVKVRDGDGAAVENAVVSLKPLFDLSGGPVAGLQATMKQEHTMFVPFVLPVRVGTEVHFTNSDAFSHQVYSFSKAKQFEFIEERPGDVKKVLFDVPGVVALGSNIHDNMLAFIYVCEHPIFGKTGQQGHVNFQELAPGRYEVHVWHPDLPRSFRLVPTILHVPDAGPIEHAVLLQLRPIRYKQQGPAMEKEP